MQTFMAFVCGILFGAGLTVAGMTNPAKVLGFLDVFGHFDPTLAVVMGSALVVTVPGFALARRRDRPWLAERFQMPTRREIDARLVLGSLLFGVGWGLVGLCPGPALANLSRASAGLFAFVGPMLAATLLHRRMGHARPWRWPAQLGARSRPV